ncbi:hypothetical protein K474DRAFT_1664198 [Panus rudis PR-1116 ss-1]|nr:hypothetical protein K474DRAFT_1664198 [Panus rudis PR-1116 ss-1]
MPESVPDSDDHRPSPPPADGDALQPSMTIHPVNGAAAVTTFSGVPMHMYPFPPGMISSGASRTKRRQVKNACTNCQKACKKCDDARPCLRCVKYGIAEECHDSQRKERAKGIKRGPYKKRDGKSNTVEQTVDVSVQPQPVQVQAAAAAAPPPGAPQPLPFAMPYPGIVGQYPTPGAKPGETIYVPQVYIPVPAPGPMQDGEIPPFPPNTHLMPITIAGYPQGYPQFVIPAPPAHARHDGHMMMPPIQYGAYPQPVYVKQPTREELAQMEHANRRDVRDVNRMGEGVSGHANMSRE